MLLGEILHGTIWNAMEGEPRHTNASIYLTIGYFTAPTVEVECRPVMPLVFWNAGCLRSMVGLKPEEMVSLLPQIFNRIMTCHQS